MTDDDTRQPLTEKELAVATGVAEGCSNREIGRRLFITEDTVKSHLRRIFGKVGVRGRDELMTVLFRAGVLWFDWAGQLRVTSAESEAVDRRGFWLFDRAVDPEEACAAALARVGRQ
jgi:DNA-binding CsgD family transcriptional regulator